MHRRDAGGPLLLVSRGSLVVIIALSWPIVTGISLELGVLGVYRVLVMPVVVIIAVRLHRRRVISSSLPGITQALIQLIIVSVGSPLLLLLLAGGSLACSWGAWEYWLRPASGWCWLCSRPARPPSVTMGSPMVFAGSLRGNRGR